ncbi:pimeloyl-ACP methyl ester carboxylesterase [Herbihabitans rhizosphaerae]|uniref:Pimeloyl-ACP methyl ester carboxylesterase n=1 Tax=Herbihabitans rhizosphaerae TaxID=1872711 RepID=A0A4Q7KL96_9PSEU|nr:alpha/beta fold hydrolase [Herbihabitans rhizosphaerae]RZS37016.1 pimeloyl-ACP methyl ester carboxylesterase [Herbihabitans rhizosphaerae]
MTYLGGHAIVLGASMAGLFTAKVLADTYDQVTVVERDELPDGPGNRRGVPQGAHAHLLLPRGSELIDSLFPGILDELVAAGVPVADNGTDVHFSAMSHVLRTDETLSQVLSTYLPGRPLLESTVRERVRALPNVRLLDRTEVSGLVTAGSRVTGARGSTVDGERELTGDLVVDALGRAARGPAWLEQLGYGRPEERLIKVDVAYASQLVRLKPLAVKEKLVLVGGHADRHAGLGLFAHEDETWDFTVFGIAGNRPPTDPDGMIDFIERCTPPHVVAALRDAERLSEVATHRYPASRWRRYDKMERLPAGLIAIGDSVCTFNPTYGQGMTVAAMQVDALRRCLRDGDDDLPRRFFAATAAPIEQAWRSAAIADRALHGRSVKGLPVRDRYGSARAERFLRAATEDARLTERFLRTFGLLDQPEALMRPSNLGRIVRTAVRKRPAATVEPPAITGARRSFVTARGVRFHVTEAGNGTPVLALHGWPQHHFAYRHLLADPPDGLRIIAPDLPGYGWSGPPPHRWDKEDVVSDVLALLDEMGLDRVVLVGHDWGGWIGHLLALRAPERVAGFLALNIAHPWQTPRTMLPHLWRFMAYQPPVAAFGVPLHRRTRFLERIVFKRAVAVRTALGPEVVRGYADRFRDPVCARAATDTYRTFWLRELPRQARAPEQRRGTVPIRAVFGVADFAIHHSLAAAETANAEDYTLELVSGCGHFIPEERPDLVRTRLIELATR